MTPITQCPLCNGTTFIPYLQTTDYSVSHETFSLVQCTSCKFVITSPVPEDLGKYYASDVYISHANKTNSLTDILYKIARKSTVQWKVNLIEYYRNSEGKSLLDYGCGTGYFLREAQQRGWKISGVEPADQPRESAQQRTRTSIVKNLEQLPDTTFDVITLWHVLEHIPDLHIVLTKLLARLSSKGTLLIAVPNHASADAKHYGKFWAAYDTPRHLWHFTRNDMIALLGKHAVTVRDVLPMKLDALYVSMLSERYKQSSGPALIKGIWQGIRSNLKAQADKEYSSLIYIATR